MGARFARMVLVPCLLYLAGFVLLTWPLILQFSTHYFADAGDGSQGVWSLWWVNKAVSGLHSSPWFTTWLHYPGGVSLLPHNLTPFNGFMAIPLLRFLSLEQAHNVIVVFSFAAGGWTAFLLAHHLTRAFLPSLLAGYVFTFSSFHFMHATGHLQLVALEWMPLFLLAWIAFLERPSQRRALYAAGALFLVILCDYYYFLFCVLAGGLVAVWWIWQHSIASFRKADLAPATTFVVASLASCGSLIFPLYRLSLRDPLVGGHFAWQYSMDLLAPIVHGGHWRFASLTQGYWARVSPDPNETSVHLGLSVIFLCAVALWRNRGPRRDPQVTLWVLVGAVFGLLALGPILRVAGRTVYEGAMPYDLLERIFPPLELAGVPIRMIVISQLAAALLAASGAKELLARPGRGRAIAAIAFVVLVVEYLPGPRQSARLETPPAVEYLIDHPRPGGIADFRYPKTTSLLWAVRHGRPLTFGYVSRMPASVAQRDSEVVRLVRLGRFSEACIRFGIGQFVLPPLEEEIATLPGVRVVFREPDVQIVEVEGCPRSAPTG